MGLMSDISCVYHSFVFIVFLFFNDEPDDDDSGSGLSGTCPFSFSGNSVHRVSASKSVGRVSGIFSVGQITEIFSCSKHLVVSNSEFLI